MNDTIFTLRQILPAVTRTRHKVGTSSDEEWRFRELSRPMNPVFQLAGTKSLGSRLEKSCLKNRPRSLFHTDGSKGWMQKMFPRVLAGRMRAAIIKPTVKVHFGNPGDDCGKIVP